MSRFWKRMGERIQENATGILGTVAFHLVLVLIFLVIKISTEKSRLEDLIVVDFDETPEQDQPRPEAPDPEFEQKLARYLAEPRSNIPVNVARQIDRELSTEDYVKELEKTLDAKRPEEYKETRERIRELEEMQKEELMAESRDTSRQASVPYKGPTNIYYELKDRYHLRLPVPVYKCEGAGLVEVKIAVDRSGRVVQAETDKPGDTANEICLTEAALNAAYGTRFNADYNAPARQLGTITYHFIAQ